jgi:general secretion pathway protein H
MRARRASGGFTLLELLAVVVIIGIVLSAVILSISDPRSKQLTFATEQLQALTQLAQEQALFNSEEIGIQFWASGYQFLRRDQQQWLPISDNTALRARELPEDLSLALYLEGLRVQLPSTLSGGKAAAAGPQVFLFPSGEITPFEVRVEDAGGAHTSLIADALGNLDIPAVTAQTPTP